MGRRRNLARESSSEKNRENATGELLTAAATVGNGIPYAKGPQMTRREGVWRRGHSVPYTYTAVYGAFAGHAAYVCDC